MRANFLVFEGLDGSGLTTQATLLRNFLQSKNKNILLTKEPTDGLIGGLIKACLRGEWKTSPETLQTLFAADRQHHLNTEIEPSLRQGKIVISDRYILSSYAFGILHIPLSKLKQMNAEFRKPNMTFFIDTQPDVCVDRIKKARPHLELHEDKNTLQQIRKNYLAMKNLYPQTYVIDGNREPLDIAEEIRRIYMKNSTRYY